MDRLWYAAYGSNLHRPRFDCYLTGGRPPGAERVYPGCRDRSPVPPPRPLTLPGEMYFGWHSRVWDGGICFLDPDAPSDPLGTPAVGYLVTAGQFADVVAQEMRADPGEPIDIAPAMRYGRHRRGPGRYETLVYCGDLDGHPILTFTSDRRIEGSAPSAAYLRTVLAGLVDGHGLCPTEAAGYLARRPGIGRWSPSRIAALATVDTPET